VKPLHSGADRVGALRLGNPLPATTHAGIGGSDPILTAQTAESLGGNPQGSTRILVAVKDPSDTLDLINGGFVHDGSFFDVGSADPTGKNEGERKTPTYPVSPKALENASKAGGQGRWAS
ncbi:uncharacterized protein METZ01_LOCUS217420, partial [marine metagenome]